MDIHLRLLGTFMCLIATTTLPIAGFAKPAHVPSVSKFKIAYSEKLDAATLLNAISDNPMFNAPWKELREFWLAKISEDSSVQIAFNRWKGRGIQLAYLLSAIPENDLDQTLERLDNPKPMFSLIRQNLDEPAYENIFNDFMEHSSEVKLLFNFFLRNGFTEMRARNYQALLDSTRQRLEKNLENIDVDKFTTLLEIFSGRTVPKKELTIYVLAFSRPLSFQLAGFAIGWASETENWAWLLTHEFMHKFNPTKSNLDKLRDLAKNDTFYKESFERIYDEFNEGEEEEFVEAASRYIMVRLGLNSKLRSLRSMKFLYYSSKTNRGGVPLACILFNELCKTEIHAGSFDYNVFIDRCFRNGTIKAGQIQQLFQQSIRPVSGMIGMSIVSDERGARIERTFKDYPAEKVGLSPGDVILKIDSVSIEGKSREDILDLLAGESGKTIRITYMHREEVKLAEVTLR